MSLSNRERMAVERKIARQCINDLLDAGYEITVNDGGDDVLELSMDEDEIIEAMFSTDEDYLIVYLPGQAARSGWVRFVYGNDGPDVINDYTTKLEQVLTRTNELSQQEEDKLYN